MSRITRIAVERLVNTGNFENFRLEAESLLDEGDDPAEHMRALQDWVDILCEERLAAVTPWRGAPASRRHPEPPDEDLPTDD